MFLRNAWYVAASIEEVTDKPLARTLLNEPIVLFRDRNGVCAALEDRCCHRGAPLSLGWQGERGIVCGYHGLEFDGAGACVHIPGNKGEIPERLRQRTRVRSYPVFEKDAFVWIWMGEPTIADPSQIIDCPPDDPIKAPRVHGMIHIKASYIYLLENLMDLSHLSFLHKNSIGSSADDSANASMDINPTKTGVKFLRLMRNATPSNASKQRHNFQGFVDRWSEFEFVAPSCIVQWSGAVNAGEYDKGVREGGESNRIVHTITPETDKTCHYFFAMSGGYGGAEATRKLAFQVFREDADMIEQQQIRLDGYDQSRLVDIPSDVARVQMNRYLNRRIEEESRMASNAAE
ncbi:aromatic ring-hydroxylating dioxygenase subunit alpha [Bradyrhizobium mercantei]|uniref:aromatic ring-hydroxylating dioxygenase subunit alpha n=1 Tax=Bradyrhizobium mercantei TaxID=1904807 RepID=UPI0009767243|nr:aromatic ring-hydroxylating dioxygenase subunit alpha [Bradyrhizobium mercantei]